MNAGAWISRCREPVSRRHVQRCQSVFAEGAQGQAARVENIIRRGMQVSRPKRGPLFTRAAGYERLDHPLNRLLLRAGRIQAEPGMREGRPAALVLRVHVGPGVQ